MSVISLLLKKSVTIRCFTPAEGFCLLHQDQIIPKWSGKEVISLRDLSCEIFPEISHHPHAERLPAINPGGQTPSLYSVSFQTSNFGLSHSVAFSRGSLLFLMATSLSFSTTVLCSSLLFCAHLLSFAFCFYCNISERRTDLYCFSTVHSTSHWIKLQ